MGELIPLIPDMTDYDKPSGLVTESDHFGGDYGWRAFTDNSGVSRDYWFVGGNNQWVQYEFEEEVYVSQVGLATGYTTGVSNGIKNFQIINPDTDEVIYVGTRPNTGEYITYGFPTKKLKRIRFLVIDGYASNGVMITRANAYGQKIKQENYIKKNEQYLKLENNEVTFTTEVSTIQLPLNLETEYSYHGSQLTLKNILQHDSTGDFQLIMCTDDLEIENADAQTTHELNLLQDDLLQAEEVEILNWFENEGQAELAVQGELNSKFTHITELKNSSQIGKIVATDNNLGTKYLVSLDKEEWKRWNGVDWEVVSWDNRDEINSLGMSKNTLKDITEEQWSLLGEEFYLGLYLNDHDSIIEQIDFQELIPNETPKIESGKLYILNTMAAIDVQLIGNKIFGNISDEDDNKVQYRITLNGEPILPATGDFTDLHPQPQHINFRIPSEKIKMDDLNHLVIEFQDVWGSTDTWQESFIGTLSGLLFYDETGELYSDDVGNIQKMLDFGIVLAGQFSEPQKITLHNTLGHPVKDVKIYTDWGEEGKPQGTGMGYSPNDSPFTSTETISPTLPMDDQEEFDFHVRLETDLHATDDVIGEMKICVTATEITDEEYEKLLKENGIE